VQMGLPAEQLRPLRPGDRIEHGNITITAVRADHMHPQNPQPDAVGLVLSYGDIRVYHAGDTAYTAEVRDSVTPLGPLRAALLPISGKRCILTAEDAAFYAGDLNADIVVPIHYGMFAENSGDPTELLHYMRRYEVKSRLIPLPFLGGLILEPSQAQLAGLECGCH
ncbi:MAG: beta-lactamase domain protein, partial [Firmicutes bacterium]|nr:beta-lactamase domain protein [Bacillota bacterium]